MNDSPVHFAHPEFTHALWVWACAVLVLVFLERRGSDALDRLVSPALQGRLVDRPSRWRRWARVALLGVSGFAMIIALMQPQWGSRFVATPRVGAEIMIALDVSRSMLADDAKPSRLERAKAEISDLLSYLEDDYVGLIAFAGRATVLSPMTPDKSFLRLALDRAGPHVVSRGGTNLAEPILRAVAGMGEPGPAQRALLLITDGEDHDSFAMDAATAAADAGIKIIAIGFGDETGSQIYLRDSKTGARSLLRDGAGQAVVSRLDGDLLREIALATDGAFVPAGTGVLDLASIYDAHIAPLTRGQLDSRGRTIRDEAFQFFVLLSIVCLVAAVFIASASGTARGSRAARVVPLVMAIVSLSGSAPVTAQPQTAAKEAPTELSDANDTNDAKNEQGTNATKESPRTTFNRGNTKLAEGDPIAATTLLRAARRDATDDVQLRYAATYNLGVAASVRADALEADDPSEALAALYEAADWFREAVVARPDESDPRHNLDVTLRRALILSDQIANENQQELDAALDAMIEIQRQRVAQTAGLLEAVVRSGELGAAEELRPAFRDSATQQRIVLADAHALGERVARDRERLASVAEADRSPEQVLEAAQLEGLLIHLDSAIERMGQTRRQLRQRRAERAYRRGSRALGDLKRARDQLRGLVPQIDILLAEVGQLANATSALARAGLSQDPAAAAAEPTALPAFLTRESVEADSEEIEARVSELATRLALAAQQATQSMGDTDPSPLSSGADQAGTPDQRRQGIALQEAAPWVASAGAAMERVTGAIREGRYELALVDEVKAGEALAAARERFFDLRQLLNVAHSDEQQIVTFAGSEDLAVAREGGEVAAHLAEIQSRNSLRGIRLKDLLEAERNDRIAALESEGASAATPAGDPSSDPAELERQRFDLADQWLVLATDAMQQTTIALDQKPGAGAPDWPRVGEAAARAAEHLDAIRTLFFSIAEHVRKLALDQLDVRDRTQDLIALSVTEPASEQNATAADAMDANDAAGATSPAEPQPEPRGPDTLLGASALGEDQQKLESRGGEIADALFVQAEKIESGATEDAPPDAAAERDRIRKAAEHVALAQLAMGDAGESLGAESGPLTPAQEAQTLAVEELNAALALLSPPPPPEESQPQQDESQSDDESQEAEGEQASGESGSEDADEESMGDPSQLLQGVRDRDAERRSARDREATRRRMEPVEKDW